MGVKVLTRKKHENKATGWIPVEGLRKLRERAILSKKRHFHKKGETLQRVEPRVLATIRLEGMFRGGG